MTGSKSGKPIFGFVGLLASGKGTAVQYLAERYQASTFRYSTILRDLLGRVYLEQSRDNLIKISECIRATFGEDILAKAIAGDAKRAVANLVVVDGIRRLADIEHLLRLPNFVLIEIFADAKVRYARLVERGENVDDTAKTYEQFLKDHERSTEMSILEVIPQAVERVDNNGTLQDLYRQLDNLIVKHKV